MSAPYRTSLLPPPYADLTPFAHALVQAAPDRLVWGSDWPHVLLETEMPNDGDLVDQIAVWVPDEAVRRRILVDNAERLYGFGRLGAHPFPCGGRDVPVDALSQLDKLSPPALRGRVR